MNPLIAPLVVPYIENPVIVRERAPSRPIRPPPLPHDTRASKDRDNRYGVIVRELIEPQYGDFKVLQRVDGLFAVLDLHAPVGAECPIFEHEIDARSNAARRADAGVADGGRKF